MDSSGLVVSGHSPLLLDQTLTDNFSLIDCKTQIQIIIHFTKQCSTIYTHTNCERFDMVKFIYSEKATKFCEIFTLLLTGTA